MRHVPPHEVADAIALALEALGAGNEEKRSQAFAEAARAARALYPPHPAEMPVVLVTIDENSRIDVKQSIDVVVAFFDKREAHDAAVILPRQDQADEIMAALSGRHLVGIGDAKGITANTIGQLAKRAVIVAGMKEGKDE